MPDTPTPDPWAETAANLRQLVLAGDEAAIRDILFQAYALGLTAPQTEMTTLEAVPAGLTAEHGDRIAGALERIAEALEHTTARTGGSRIGAELHRRALTDWRPDTPEEIQERADITRAMGRLAADDDEAAERADEGA